MAQKFNIVAQLNIQGPANLKQTVAKIQRQLQGVNANVNVNVSGSSVQQLKQMQKQLGQVSKNVQATNKTLSQFNKSGAKVSSVAAQAGKNLQVARTAAQDFGHSIALATKRFAAFTIGAGILGGFTTAISKGVAAAIDFERQMIKVSQVTGKSMQGLGSLEQTITSLAKGLGVASSELVDVSRTLAQTGMTAREVKVALDALAKSSLAPTFKDMSNTAEGAIAIMRQFGVGVDQLASKLGSINAVAGQFAVESQDLIFAIRRAGGAFKAAGGNLEELLALFTSVRQTTRESAETIATGFRTIFTRMQRPKTIEFLRQAGVELQNLQGNFVGPMEAVKRLNNALSTLESTDPRFQKIIEELGGFRQVSKVIPLIQQYSTAQRALKAAMQGQDSLAKDAATAQQSLAVQATKVREQFAGLMREIVGSSAFKGFAKVALSIASSLIKVGESIKPLLPLIAGLAAFKTIQLGAQFASGFAGGLGKGGGGAQGVGQRVAGGMTGQNQVMAATKQVQALTSNTTALNQLTKSIVTLTTAVGRMSLGGGTRKFNTGGVVPGTGNRDTVPAMLTPGEFVIRKSSVEQYGAENLQKLNLGGKKTGDVSRSRRLGGGAKGATYAESRSKRFGKRMQGGAGKAYAFDFDDTLAVSDAVVKEDAEDPFEEFRGDKGAKFVRSAKATKIAAMARTRASRGHDIYVVTARPGDKSTRSSIGHFMRGIGAPAKDVIGVGGTPGPGNTSQKKAQVLTRLKKQYGDITFLDDDDENVLAASQVAGVKSIKARKNMGGIIQKMNGGGKKKKSSGPKSRKQNIGEQTKELEKGNLLNLYGRARAVGGFFAKPKGGSDESKFISGGNPFDIRSGPHKGEQGKIMDGKYPILAPRYNEGSVTKGQPQGTSLATAVQAGAALGGEQAVIDALRVVRNKKILPKLGKKEIKPVATAKARDEIKKSTQVVNSISGYVYESVIQSLSGIELGGEQEGWDIPNIQGDQAEKLSGIFGPAAKNIKTAEVKFDKDKFSSQEKGIPSKLRGEVNKDSLFAAKHVGKGADSKGFTKQKKGKGKRIPGAYVSETTLDEFDNRAMGGLIQKFKVGGKSKPLAGGMLKGKGKGKEKPKRDFGGSEIAIRGGVITARYGKGSGKSGQVTAGKMFGKIWEVSSSEATKGFGPHLYDLVMEGATSKGGMLVSDRASVSADARRVWDFYYSKRPDVRKQQLQTAEWPMKIDTNKFPSEDPSTWPPKSDVASWSLKHGYMKSPTLLNSPDVKQMAAGGVVPGQGNRDTVPAMLTPGEFVIRKSSVEKYGAENLQKLNRGGKKLASSKGVKKSKSGPAKKKKGFVEKSPFVQMRINPPNAGPAMEKEFDDWNATFTASNNAPDKDVAGKKLFDMEGWFEWDGSQPEFGLHVSKTHGIIEAAKGKGYGSAGYKKLHDWTTKARIGMFSDASVSPSAQKLWMGLKKNYGIPIEQTAKETSFSKASGPGGGKQILSGPQDESVYGSYMLADGGGNMGTDTVPALLTPGEFVVNKSTAEKVGYGNLGEINRGTAKGFASGGVVQKFNMGGRPGDLGGPSKMRRGNPEGIWVPGIGYIMPEDMPAKDMGGLNVVEGPAGPPPTPKPQPKPQPKTPKPQTKPAQPTATPVTHAPQSQTFMTTTDVDTGPSMRERIGAGAARVAGAARAGAGAIGRGAGALGRGAAAVGGGVAQKIGMGMTGLGQMAKGAAGKAGEGLSAAKDKLGPLLNKLTAALGKNVSSLKDAVAKRISSAKGLADSLKNLAKTALGKAKGALGKVGRGAAAIGGGVAQKIGMGMTGLGQMAKGAAGKAGAGFSAVKDKLGSFLDKIMPSKQKPQVSTPTPTATATPSPSPIPTGSNRPIPTAAPTPPSQPTAQTTTPSIPPATAAQAATSSAMADCINICPDDLNSIISAIQAVGGGGGGGSAAPGPPGQAAGGQVAKYNQLRQKGVNMSEAMKQSGASASMIKQSMASGAGGAFAKPQKTAAPTTTTTKSSSKSKTPAAPQQQQGGGGMFSGGGGMMALMALPQIMEGLGSQVGLTSEKFSGLVQTGTQLMMTFGLVKGAMEQFNVKGLLEKFGQGAGGGKRGLSGKGIGEHMKQATNIFEKRRAKKGPGMLGKLGSKLGKSKVPGMGKLGKGFGKLGNLTGKLGSNMKGLLSSLTKTAGGATAVVGALVAAGVAIRGWGESVKKEAIEDAESAKNSADEEKAMSKYTRGKVTSGGGTGLATGAVAGAAIGSFIPVIGTVLGGVIGGAIGGIAGMIGGYFGSNSEIIKAIQRGRQVRILERLDKNFKRFGKQGTTAVAVTGVSNQVSAVMNNLKNVSDPKQYKSMREEIKKQLPQIRNVTNEMAKQADSIDEFESKFGGAGKSMLQNIADLEGIPYAEVREEYEQQIKQGKKLRDSQKASEEAFRAQKNLMAEINVFKDAMKQAADVTAKYASAQSAVVGAALGEDVTASFGGTEQDRDILGRAAAGETVDPAMLSKAIQQNSPNEEIQKQAEAQARLNDELPNILFEAAKATGKGAGDEKFEAEVALRLKDAKFGKAITKSVTASLGEKTAGSQSGEGKVKGEAIQDSEKLAEELTKSSPDILSAIQGIGDAIVQTQQNLNGMLQNKAKLEEAIMNDRLSILKKQNQIADTEAKFAGKDITPAEASAREAKERAVIMQGGAQAGSVEDVSGFAGADAATIGAEAAATQEQIQKQREYIQSLDQSSVAHLSATQGLHQLNQRSQHLQAGLQNMANSTHKLTALQNKLSKAQKQREFKENTLTDVAFGTNEERKQFEVGMTGMQFMQRGGEEGQLSNFRAQGPRGENMMKQGLARLKSFEAAGIQVADLENDPSGETKVDAKEIIRRRAKEDIKSTIKRGGAHIAQGMNDTELDKLIDAQFQASKSEKELQAEIVKTQKDQLAAQRQIHDLKVKADGAQREMIRNAIIDGDNQIVQAQERANALIAKQLNDAAKTKQVKAEEKIQGAAELVAVGIDSKDESKAVESAASELNELREAKKAQKDAKQIEESLGLGTTEAFEKTEDDVRGTGKDADIAEVIRGVMDRGEAGEFGSGDTVEVKENTTAAFNQAFTKMFEQANEKRRARGEEEIDVSKQKGNIEALTRATMESGQLKDGNFMDFWEGDTEDLQDVLQDIGPSVGRIFGSQLEGSKDRIDSAKKKLTGPDGALEGVDSATQERLMNMDEEALGKVLENIELVNKGLANDEGWSKLTDNLEEVTKTVNESAAAIALAESNMRAADAEAERKKESGMPIPATIVDEDRIKAEPHAGGGPIGPSFGSSAGSMSKGTDTRMAVLTPGEFVINKKATSKNKNLLQSINSGGQYASKGGLIYAAGGGFFGKILQAVMPGVGMMQSIGKSIGGGGGGKKIKEAIQASTALPDQIASSVVSKAKESSSTLRSVADFLIPDWYESLLKSQAKAVSSGLKGVAKFIIPKPMIDIAKKQAELVKQGMIKGAEFAFPKTSELLFAGGGKEGAVPAGAEEAVGESSSIFTKMFETLSPLGGLMGMFNKQEGSFSKMFSMMSPLSGIMGMFQKQEGSFSKMLSTMSPLGGLVGMFNKQEGTFSKMLSMMSPLSGLAGMFNKQEGSFSKMFQLMSPLGGIMATMESGKKQGINAKEFEAIVNNLQNSVQDSGAGLTRDDLEKLVLAQVKSRQEKSLESMPTFAQRFNRPGGPGAPDMSVTQPDMTPYPEIIPDFNIKGLDKLLTSTPPDFEAEKRSSDAIHQTLTEMINNLKVKAPDALSGEAENISRQIINLRQEAAQTVAPINALESLLQQLISVSTSHFGSNETILQEVAQIFHTGTNNIFSAITASTGGQAEGVTQIVAAIKELSGSAGISVRGFSSGGPVGHGAGIAAGRSSKGTDTRLASLTPGEFVVNKRATSKNMGALQALNAGGEVEELKPEETRVTNQDFPLGRPKNGWVGDGKRPTSFLSNSKVLDLMDVREMKKDEESKYLSDNEMTFTGSDGKKYGTFAIRNKKLIESIVGTSKDSPYPLKQKEFNNIDFGYEVGKFNKVYKPYGNQSDKPLSVNEDGYIKAFFTYGGATDGKELFESWKKHPNENVRSSEVTEAEAAMKKTYSTLQKNQKGQNAAAKMSEGDFDSALWYQLLFDKWREMDSSKAFDEAVKVFPNLARGKNQSNARKRDRGGFSGTGGWLSSTLKGKFSHLGNITDAINDTANFEVGARNSQRHLVEKISDYAFYKKFDDYETKEFGAQFKKETERVDELKGKSERAQKIKEDLLTKFLPKDFVNKYGNKDGTIPSWATPESSFMWNPLHSYADNLTEKKLLSYALMGPQRRNSVFSSALQKIEAGHLGGAMSKSGPTKDKEAIEKAKSNLNKVKSYVESLASQSMIKETAEAYMRNYAAIASRIREEDVDSADMQIGGGTILGRANTADEKAEGRTPTSPSAPEPTPVPSTTTGTAPTTGGAPTSGVPTETGVTSSGESTSGESTEFSQSDIANVTDRFGNYYDISKPYHRWRATNRLKYLRNYPHKTVPPQSPRSVDVAALSGGGAFGHSSGAPAGSMSKGSDTRLAVLTPGEFVVNRQATSQNRSLLESINSGASGKTYSKGGPVYLEEGGFVPTKQSGKTNVSSPSQPGKLMEALGMSLTSASIELQNVIRAIGETEGKGYSSRYDPEKNRDSFKTVLSNIRGVHLDMFSGLSDVLNQDAIKKHGLTGLGKGFFSGATKSMFFDKLGLSGTRSRRGGASKPGKLNYEHFDKFFVPTVESNPDGSFSKEEVEFVNKSFEAGQDIEWIAKKLDREPKDATLVSMRKFWWQNKRDANGRRSSTEDRTDSNEETAAGGTGGGKSHFKDRYGGFSTEYHIPAEKEKLFDQVYDSYNSLADNYMSAFQLQKNFKDFRPTVSPSEQFSFDEDIAEDFHSDATDGKDTHRTAFTPQEMSFFENHLKKRRQYAYWSLMSSYAPAWQELMNHHFTEGGGTGLNWESLSDEDTQSMGSPKGWDSLAKQVWSGQLLGNAQNFKQWNPGTSWYAADSQSLTGKYGERYPYENLPKDFANQMRANAAGEVVSDESKWPSDGRYQSKDSSKNFARKFEHYLLGNTEYDENSLGQASAKNAYMQGNTEHYLGNLPMSKKLKEKADKESKERDEEKKASDAKDKAEYDKAVQLKKVGIFALSGQFGSKASEHVEQFGKTTWGEQDYSGIKLLKDREAAKAESTKNLLEYADFYSRAVDYRQQRVAEAGTGTFGDTGEDYKFSGSPEEAIMTPEGRKSMLSAEAWGRAYADWLNFADSQQEDMTIDKFAEGKIDWNAREQGVKNYDKAINTANSLWWPGALVTAKEKEEEQSNREFDRAQSRAATSERRAEESEEEAKFKQESRPKNQGGLGREQAMRNKNERKNKKKQKTADERRVKQEIKRLERLVAEHERKSLEVSKYSDIFYGGEQTEDPYSLLPNASEFLDFVSGTNLSELASDEAMVNSPRLDIRDDGKIEVLGSDGDKTMTRTDFARGPMKSIRSLYKKIQRAAPKKFKSKGSVDWQGALNAYKNIGSQVSNFTGLYNVPGTAFHYPDHSAGMGVHPMQIAAQQGLVNEQFYGITGTEEGFTYPAGMGDVSRFNETRDPENEGDASTGQMGTYTEKGTQGISGGAVGEAQQKIREEGGKVPRPLEMMLPGGAVQSKAFKDMDSITKYKEIEKTFSKHDLNNDKWLESLELGKMFWLASKSKGGVIESLSGGGKFGANSGPSAGSLSKGTDTRLAVLTPGEFVVNRSAASKNLGLLQAINNGNNVATASKGGSIGYFNNGTPGNGEFMAKFQEAIGAFATVVSSISMSGQGAGNMDMNAMGDLTSALNNFPTSPGVQGLIKSLNSFTESFASDSIDVTLNTGGVDVKLTGTEQLAKIAEGNILELISQKVQSAFFDLMSGQFAK